jgi:hypothetical protein
MQAFGLGLRVVVRNRSLLRACLCGGSNLEGEHSSGIERFGGTSGTEGAGTRTEAARRNFRRKPLATGLP